MKNIKEKLNEGAYPTVLFTGGGYHIYQPVEIPTALENITKKREEGEEREEIISKNIYAVRE